MPAWTLSLDPSFVRKKLVAGEHYYIMHAEKCRQNDNNGHIRATTGLAERSPSVRRAFAVLRERDKRQLDFRMKNSSGRSGERSAESRFRAFLVLFVRRQRHSYFDCKSFSLSCCCCSYFFITFSFDPVPDMPMHSNAK